MKLLDLCEVLYIPIIPEEPPVSQKGSLMKLKIRMSSTATSDVCYYYYYYYYHYYYYYYLIIIVLMNFKKIFFFFLLFYFIYLN